MATIDPSKFDGRDMLIQPPPPPPPPPTPPEQFQKSADTLKEQLTKNPNDPEAKNDLAYLERVVSNELGAEHEKGDGGDPKRLDALEKTLDDVHATMKQFGVSELPHGGSTPVN